MAVTTVFVHGRGEEFKDPAALAREWQASLAAGLVKAGAAPLAGEPVFPYYANLLYQITSQTAQDPTQNDALPQAANEPGPFHPYLPEDVGRLERDILANITAASGMPAPGAIAPRAAARESLSLGGVLEDILSWGAARCALNWLAHHSGIDEVVITEYLKDVAVYLTRGRDQVLDLVRGKIPPEGPLVFVTHSLGTVVARDLFDDEPIRSRVRLWVTAGSPLGLDAVQMHLRTPGIHNPDVPWTAAYDVRDIVALGHPLQPTWRDPLQDVRVDNGDSPHSIERYLSHPEVAKCVGTAVLRG